ncbi:hypothetical protein RFI_09408 [Reticulomyxa filosa]|uniref:ABC transporter domain-containing protein n=1 Tax=Reticulomyxa filosa TaxID=46433 RepID=X6NN68_RETFI|nr:hypothetical protein RFI_09408 [Reticulomyxa filosa]|eukprot:ETO27725.1 hypothetical protein RFI_09408 [Reticulomyxa filosa]
MYEFNKTIGKTTLINILAGRVVESKGSHLEGRITVNGIDRVRLGSKFARLAAFVQQDDVLLNMQVPINVSTHFMFFNELCNYLFFFPPPPLFISSRKHNKLKTREGMTQPNSKKHKIFFSLYMLTVHETLLNAAKFRLPKEMTLKEKEERVNTIITELGLQRARDTRIGDARRRGVSGGERKRTNIGVELIQDPSLIFLDEPTYRKNEY